MRYVRIFFVYFQDAFVNRSTSFVWFLLALFNPLIALLFWRGAFQSGGTSLAGWSYQTVASYYLLLVAVNTLLMPHIEMEIARHDIQLGMLSNYLTRPFPYLLLKLFSELPWRIIQAFFAVGVLIFFIIGLGINVYIIHDPYLLVFAIAIAAVAHLVAFLFKMVLGLTALWVTDFSGLAEFADVVVIIFAGFVIPLALFPQWLRSVAEALPFAYMIYFPLISLLGQVSPSAMVRVLAGEIIWLLLFFILYSAMWRSGIKKFTGIGQ